MRGKQPQSFPLLTPYRNIPAYAGKTGLLGRKSLATREHPRVCGENDWEAATVVDPVGTSPRMRGKPEWSPTKTTINRNIPAYAGKTVYEYRRHYPA